MSYLEAVDIAVADLDPSLRGRALDRPQLSDRTDGASLGLLGWVLGREARAVAIEIEYGGRVVRRVPLGHRRPDLLTAFPDVADADQGGFQVTLDMAGIGEFDLVLRVVLADQRRVPFATLRVVHRWREDAYHAAAPLVSVVIPCYDQARYLSDAIESVLAQTYPHLEVVIVDDGSHDNTAEVGARYPGVRVVTQQNAGLSGARNSGLRHSNGAYLIFLDADDRLLPNAVADGLAAFAAHPEAAFVAGRHQVVEPLAVRPGPTIEFGDNAYAAFLRRNLVGMFASVMHQRISFQTVGEFDESLEASEDYDHMLRVARRLPVRAHDRIVASYRFHLDAISRDVGRMERTGRRVLDRQRPYVAGDAVLLSAHEAGYAAIAQFYGDLPGRVPLLASDGSEHSRETVPPLNGSGGTRLEHRLRKPPLPAIPFGLLYHRIAEPTVDPWGLCVSPRHFAEQMEVLRDAWNPVSPTRFVDELLAGHRVDGAVLVTFDDGYADNLHAALPSLERNDIPAVLFAATGYLGEPRGFWWDELRRLIFEPRTLPDECHLALAGRRFRHALAGRVQTAWRAWDEPLTGRAALYRDLWVWLRPLLRAEREQALDAIAIWAAMDRSTTVSDAILTPEEIAELAAHPLVGLGAHTVTHPWLPSLTQAMQRLEIREGARDLGAVAGRRIDLFAYPFGGIDDLGPDATRLVANSGYRAAFLSVLTPGAKVNPWQLARRQVPDVGGDKFAEWLAIDAPITVQ